MELRQIELFVVLAQHRSFTRAAEAVGIAQPALSQQVRRLERELGVQLLDRSTRPVRLTEAGSAFYARAERILADATLAGEEMREMAGAGRRRVVVGALPALALHWLPPVLAEFHAAHPAVEITVRHGNSDELARMVAAGHLDLALTHAVPGAHGVVGAPAGLVLERVFDEDLMVVVPPAHALAGRRSVTLAQLRNEPFVLVSHGSGLTQTILGGTAGVGFRPAVAVEAPDVAVVRSLVAAGLGVSVMPCLPATAPGPPVAVLALSPPLPPHAAVMARRADARPSGATETLVCTIRGRAAAEVAAHGSGGVSAAPAPRASPRTRPGTGAGPRRTAPAR